MLLYRSIGEHLGMALENARLARENLRMTVTSERQMMANEVHDSLAQTLAYMVRMAMLNDAIADRRSAQREIRRRRRPGAGRRLRHLRDLLVQFAVG